MIKFKFIYSIFFISLVFSQNFPDYGPSEQWDVVNSTQQGFIIFDDVTINGEAVVGGEMDGQAEICPDQNCDIIGVMFNNIPVGWGYCSVVNDGITLAVNFNDSQTPGVENYPSHAAGFAVSTVNFHFYDASEQKVYFNIFASNAEPFNLVEVGNLAITGDGTAVSGITIQGNWQPYDLGDPVCPLAYANNFLAFGGSGDEGLCDISFYTCGDVTACNYDNILNTCDNGVGDCSSNDGCDFPIENFDCDENCIEELDCDGVCGGDLVEDCTGECGGSGIIDDCGVCNGANADMDCAGECFGSALEDNCGVCDTNPENDCTVDCAGEFGGDAEEDLCGTCDNDNSNDCVQDCNGNWGGDAEEDMCGTCDNDNSNDCVQDCNDVWGGDDLEDMCGTCDNDISNDCVQDCNGDWGGDAYLDCQETCSSDEGFIGGNEYLDDFGIDCNGDCNGEAYIDLCGVCVSGNTGLEECTCNDWEMDCQGNCPGFNYLANSTGYHYNSEGEILTHLLTPDEFGNYSITEETLINSYGEFYLDSLEIINIELGYDCSMECAGDYVVDCTDECLPNGQNLLVNDCSNTYYDEYGNLIEVNCESIMIGAEYCCNHENVDCNDECYGSYEEDLNESCCDSQFVGCDGICGDLETPPATVDDCGFCDGSNYINNDGELVGPRVDCNGVCDNMDSYIGDIGDNGNDACGVCSGSNIDLGDGFITGPDADCAGVCYGGSMIDCAGVCNGDAIVETFYFDNDFDGLGSNESMSFCNVNVPEGWILNSNDIDDNCFSNIHDCSGVCDGSAIEDCLNNCSDTDEYIGLTANLNEYGLDCNGICNGEAEIDLCGVCAGGDTNIDFCSCDEWEKDCAGNCPGFTYLGNNANLQYNSSIEFIDTLLVMDGDGNYFIDNNYFEGLYGEFWLDSINIEDISIGYDCSGNCEGEAYTDCQNACSDQPEFIGNQNYLDENGFDCLNECNGIAYEDICGICYSDGFDAEVVNLGFCYVNGESNGELCGLEGDMDSCSEGFCFIEGNDADECGMCFGTNQCIYNLTVTADSDYPDVQLNWNSIESEENVTYFVYRNNELTFETTNNWLNDNGLEFNTDYCYKIAAEIGDEYIQFINEYEDCITTTNELPHYIFSFPEVITTPPNMPLHIPVNLSGLQNTSIFEMNIIINYNPEVFSPSIIEGINSFSAENYSLEINYGENIIDLYLASISGDGLVIENEDVLLISGFSGNGNTDMGTISLTANISNSSGTPLSLLFYDGLIQISDFYVSLVGAIEYYSNGQNTSNVDLELEGYTSLNQYFADGTVTDISGEFAFYGILPGSYDVIPSKNNILDIGDELSSTDASQIARNSIGLIQFTNYQQLAADVTLNGNISGLDASKVARFRIGQIDALNESGIHWVFYPEILDVEDLMVNAINEGNSLISADCEYNPNVLENTCTEGPFRNLPCGEEMINSPDCPLFLSIRLGDVTGNWNPSPFLTLSSERTDPVEFFIEDEEFSLPIRITDFEEMQGVDITIQFDNEMIQLENVRYLENELSNLGYNLMFNEIEGEMKISSFATMQLCQIEEFIVLDFSMINSVVTTTDIQISKFLFNELETESGFEIQDENGNFVMTDHIVINTTNLSNSEIQLPNSYSLYQNYPNPFNPITEISFDLPFSSKVSVEIYDITGQLIKNLIDNNIYAAGNHKMKWDASSHPGGIYLCRLKADNFIATHKMILLK